MGAALEDMQLVQYPGPCVVRLRVQCVRDVDRTGFPISKAARINQTNPLVLPRLPWLPIQPHIEVAYLVDNQGRRVRKPFGHASGRTNCLLMRDTCKSTAVVVDCGTPCQCGRRGSRQ
jgi:hypothetical protein